MPCYTRNTHEQPRGGHGFRGRLKALGKKVMEKLRAKLRKIPSSKPANESATPPPPISMVATPPPPPRNPLRHYVTAAELRQVAKSKHLANHQRENAECLDVKYDHPNLHSVEGAMTDLIMCSAGKEIPSGCRRSQRGTLFGRSLLLSPQGTRCGPVPQLVTCEGRRLITEFHFFSPSISLVRLLSLVVCRFNFAGGETIRKPLKRLKRETYCVKNLLSAGEDKMLVALPRKSRKPIKKLKTKTYCVENLLFWCLQEGQ
ncbi:hypothetical protein F5Y18DRAFT_3415 [Xylariaceae sp. FL1019]|nr:hypothetical protein F5Y18DRAFT_3415 [Xylariaceae sp. FL1019]